MSSPALAHNSDLSITGLMKAGFHPQEVDYFCLANPKSACSSLKYNLWKLEHERNRASFPPPANKGGAGVHSTKKSPLRRITEETLLPALDSSAATFTIVRNPYARLLSSYMDKIMGNKRPKKFLLMSLGLRENEDISFEQFVRHVCSTDAREMDKHWAPQSYLTQIRDLSYDYIGAVENLDPSIRRILDLVSGGGDQDAARAEEEALASFRPHSTSAAERLRTYYTDELAAAVAERYADDFEMFGYSRDIRDASNPPAIPASLMRSSGARRMSEALSLIARIEEALGTEDLAGARELVQALSTDDASLASETLYMVGEVHYASGDYDAADRFLKEAIARNEKVARYWGRYAETLLKLGRTAEAVDAAEQTVAAGPGRRRLLLIAAACHKANGNMEKHRKYREDAKYFTALNLADSDSDD